MRVLLTRDEQGQPAQPADSSPEGRPSPVAVVETPVRPAPYRLLSRAQELCSPTETNQPSPINRSRLHRPESDPRKAEECRKFCGVLSSGHCTVSLVQEGPKTSQGPNLRHANRTGLLAEHGCHLG